MKLEGLIQNGNGLVRRGGGEGNARNAIEEGKEGERQGKKVYPCLNFTPRASAAEPSGEVSADAWIFSQLTGGGGAEGGGDDDEDLSLRTIFALQTMKIATAPTQRSLRGRKMIEDMFRVAIASQVNFFLLCNDDDAEDRAQRSASERL